MKTQVLLNDLIEMSKKNTADTQNFMELSDEILNYKGSPQSWSILECIEHLNRYGDFYLPEIKQRIRSSKHKRVEKYKSGWLGEYFAMSMLPKEKLNKMKTFKSMNPSGSSLDKRVIEKFLSQQEEMLNLLAQAKEVDLTKTKTSISISKWIKLRLGDTLRVVIYHNKRHIVQAKNVLTQSPHYELS